MSTIGEGTQAENKTYNLTVVCMNCRHETSRDIPCGISTAVYMIEHMCGHCGCTLAGRSTP